MNRNELIETVKAMMNASSCCKELKDAGQKYLDSCGTADEKAAFDALTAEVKEDISTLEHALEFYESPVAVRIFGAERAKALADHSRARLAQGEKWCDCPACAAGLKILEYAGIQLA